MESNVRLYVCNIPKGFGLFPLKLAIGEAIGNNDALLTIEYVRKKDSKIIEGVSEVQLKNGMYANILIEKGLKITYRDEARDLTIAKCMPEVSSGGHHSTEDNQQSGENACEQRMTDKPENRPIPAPRRLKASQQPQEEKQLEQQRKEQEQQEEQRKKQQRQEQRRKRQQRQEQQRNEQEEHQQKEKQRQEQQEQLRQQQPQQRREDEVHSFQRRIECRNVPLCLFNRKDMFRHFQQYGPIEDLFFPKYLDKNRKPFVKVKYVNHEFAKRALQEGGNLHEIGHTMYIRWDGTEAAQVRQRLGIKDMNSDRPSDRHRSKERSSSRPRPSQPPKLSVPKAGASKAEKDRESTSQTRQTDLKNSSPLAKPWGDAAGEKVYEWFDILQENRQLFGDEAKSSCVLLQTSHADMSDGVRRHFRNNYSVDIEHVYPMPDGLLVILNETDAGLVLSQQSLIIGEEKINVVAKSIPKKYKDRMLLEGSFDDVIGVGELLECCDIADDVSYDVIKLESSSFLVEFSREMDIDNIMEEIANNNLEEYNPKAYPMCGSDCVKVENLAKSVKNDFVKLVFQNKKNGGGKVTRVEREEESSTALVYFANYEDAERVASKAYGEIQIKKQPIDVSLYFRNAVEAISDESDGDDDFGKLDARRAGRRRTRSNRRNKPRAVYRSSNKSEFVSRTRNVQGGKVSRGPRAASRDTGFSAESGCAVPKTAKRMTRKKVSVREFETSPKADPDVISYVRKSSNGYDRLRKDLGDLCELEVVESPSICTLRFRPSIKKLEEDLKYNQEEFEKACNLIVDNFFSQFVTKSATYLEHNVVALRNAMKWNEEHEFVKVEVDQNSLFDVYIRWSAQCPGQVTVTGEPNDVINALKFMTGKCDVVEQTLSFAVNHYRALSECNVIRRICQELENKVDIETEEMPKERYWKLTLKGSKANVEEAKNRISAAMTELTSRALSDMGRSTEFLVSALQRDRDGLQGDVVDVRRIIQQRFHDSHIYVSLQLKGDEACIVHSDPFQLDKAQKLLDKIIVQESIDVEEGILNLIGTAEWKEMKKDVTALGSVQVYANVSQSSIEVVGLSQNFRKAFDAVSNCVRENAIVTKPLRNRADVIKFLGSIAGAPRKVLKDVELDFETDDSLVLVKGAGKRVQQAVNWLKEATSNLPKADKSAPRPGGGFKATSLVEPRPRPPAHGTIVRQFWTHPKVVPDVINYIRKSGMGFDRLREDLEGLCDMSIVEKPNSVSFCFRPCTEDLGDHLKYNQNEWEKTCNAIVNEFFKQFGSKTALYKAYEVVSLRATMNWKLDQEFVKVELDQHITVEVYIRWSVQDPGKVTVAGYIDDVTNFLQYVTKKCEVTEQIMSVPLHVFRALRECNIVSRIGKDLRGEVEIKTEQNTSGKRSKSSFRMRGSREKVDEAKTLMRAAMMKLRGGRMSDTGSRAEYLLSALISDRDGLQPGEVDVRQVIQAEFDEQHIQVSLQLRDDQPCLMYFDSDERGRALEALREIVKQETIEVKDGLREVVSTPEWANITRNVCASGAAKVYVDIPKNSIDVVGLSQVFHKTLDKVLTYIGHHTFVSRCMGKDMQNSNKIGNSMRQAARFSNAPPDAFQELSPDGSGIQIAQLVHSEARDDSMLALFGGMPRQGSKMARSRPKAGDGLGPSTTSFQRNYYPSNSRRDTTAIAVESLTTQNSLRVSIYQGDISCNRRPATTQPPRQFSRIARKGFALPVRAGTAARLGCSEESTILQRDNMRVTSGTDMCQYVFYLNNKPNQLSDALFECFLEADELGVTDLAVPSAAVTFGLQIPTAAGCLESAIHNFDTTNPANLKQIDVYIGQQNILPYFHFNLLRQPSSVRQVSATMNVHQAARVVDSNCIPAFWEGMRGQICKRVKVAANTTEYQTVLQRFFASMPFRHVVSLERIQNPTLWHQFQAQKTEVKTKMPGQQVTKELFHSADKDTCDKIVMHGFDKSYAGRNATTYGRGIYFFKTANYSHGYATPDRQNHRCMFLAEVVFGAYCAGYKHTMSAPMQSDGSPYDSVVDCVGNPSVFVVFHGFSAYPTYLLTYVSTR